MKLPLALRITLFAAAISTLSGCADSEPPGPKPAPEVGVVTVSPTALPLIAELPGRLEASRIAEVRARAAGIVQKREFAEGSDVKAGQRLFQIDAAPYAATLESAQAALARAEASAAQARALAGRYEPLVATNAISKQEYDNAVAAAKAGEADVAMSQAAVRTARINLGYAAVTAPISGRIGRALVTEGALVGQGEATQLAVIQQIDPMYVNFTQPVADVLKLRRAVEAGRLGRSGEADAVPVRVLLDDGSEYAHPGRLLFSDLSVDPTTGQVTLRAEVPNPDGLLLPGLYVRVQLEQAQAPKAILLPQQAVTRSGQGDTVLVVDVSGEVSKRKISVSGAQGQDWIVLDGLKPGEQVMVDGFQHVEDGKPVRAVPWKQPRQPAAPKPGATPGAAR